MKRITASIAFSLLLSFTSWADGLNVEVGATYWRSQMKGLIDSPITLSSSINVNLEDNLTMQDGNNQQYYLNFQHPLPYVPNVLLSANLIKHEGQGTPYWQDIITSSSQNSQIDIKGTIDITHYDITGYWTPLDLDLLSLDAGLTYRQFNGDMTFIITFENSPVPITATFDQQYFLVYGKINVYTPLIGLSAHLTLNAGHNFNSKNPEQAFDMDIAIQYRTLVGLGVRAGYRYFDIDLESTTTVSDGYQGKTNYQLDTYGPYLSLSYRL